jgi:hypothetical protein
MSKGHSWRELRKTVILTDADSGVTTQIISVWKAADIISQLRGIEHGTARKEIRKAIKHKLKRYGFYWRFADTDT